MAEVISGLISTFTAKNPAFLCSHDQEGSGQLGVVQIRFNNILQVFCFLHQLECSWVHGLEDVEKKDAYLDL